VTEHQIPSNAASDPAPGATVTRIFAMGEMADLTRAFDWGGTSIGTIEKWPEVLLLTVNTLLASPHPMFLWWGADLIQFYNDAYRQCLRDDKHPLALGQKGQECWPEIWEVIRPQIDHVMLNGKNVWREDQLIPILRNGRLEDVYWTYAYSPVRDLAGKIGGTLVICTETTTKQMADQSLRQELKRLGDLFQQAPAFFAVLRGPQHVFERLNPLYQQLLGPRSLIGKTVHEAVPEVEVQGFIEILDQVYQTGEPFIGRGTPIKLARLGSEVLEKRYLDFVYQPIRDADGSISGIIVLGVDVTDSKRAEQVVLQTEKLAAVGRLASSIAHEINNPLESVTNLIFLAKSTAADPTTIKYLRTAEDELRRVAAITNQTLRFHKQSTKPKPTPAKDLIDSTLTIFQGRMTNSRITLSRRERAVRSVLCFEGEVRQVLSNLIGNAVDAMNATGGRLYLRTREGRNLSTGELGIVFTIADSGSGMTPETSSRIFEPFFTTKPLSGTGLGLWVSRDIVDRHKGALRLRSSQRQASHGTVFTLFLPFDAASRTL
jgi:signal transduction histidine kinase